MSNGAVAEVGSSGRWKYVVRLDRASPSFRRLLGEVKAKAASTLPHGGRLGHYDEETQQWAFRAEALGWLTEWGNDNDVRLPEGWVDWTATVEGWREDHHPDGPRWALFTGATAWLPAFRAAGGELVDGRWLFRNSPALKTLVDRIKESPAVEWRRTELDRAALLKRGYVTPRAVVTERREGWVAFAGEGGYRSRMFSTPQHGPYEPGEPGWRAPTCFVTAMAATWAGHNIDLADLLAEGTAEPPADAYVVAAGANKKQVKVWTLRRAFRSTTHGPQPPLWGATVVDNDKLLAFLAGIGAERVAFSPWLAETRWIDKPNAFGTIRLNTEGLAIVQALDEIGDGDGGKPAEERSTIDWQAGRWVITLPFTETFARVGAELLAAGGETLTGGAWRLGPDWPAARFVRDLLHLLAPSDVTEAAADEIRTAMNLAARVERLRPRMEPLARHDGTGLDRAGLDARLLPFQVATARHIAEGEGSIVADQPGTGKTFSTLAALTHRGTFPAAVACPAGLRRNWEREIGRWYPDLRCQVLRGVKPSRLPPADLYVCGWDTLYAWNDELARAGLRGAVADEARFGKNLRSRRGAAGLSLFRAVPDDGVRATLDATPVEHRLSDVWMMLVMIGFHEIAGQDKATFVRRWSSDIEGLNAAMYQTCMVRHLKRDVLDQLPPKYEMETIVVEPKGSAWGSYWNDQDEAMGFIAGMDFNDRKNRLRARGMLAALRRQVGIAKMDDTIPIVDRWDYSTAGDPDIRLLVWTHHRAVTEGLARAFKAPMIIGGMSDRARDAAIDEWAGPGGARVLVASMKSAGYGLTLHLEGRCSEQLFAEVPESGAEFEQAEDRLDRIGQTRGVQTRMVLAAGTTDAMYYRAAVAKTVLADRAIDGKVRSLDPERAASLIEQLYSWDGDVGLGGGE